LTANIRIPLIVAVNKSDLQSVVLRDKDKISFVEYHLRKFCLTYGGTLIYTSTKNHSNLDVFYEYILHRVYDFSLRFKAESINEESIFIPLGSDNHNLLKYTN
jgi:dynein light intermediate chain 1